MISQYDIQPHKRGQWYKSMKMGYAPAVNSIHI